jgi:hypothetical protein
MDKMTFPVVELEREGEVYRIPTRLDWRVLLVLAQIGGWEPVDRGEYEETFLLSHGVVVSDDEAYDLAYALDAVLDDIPDIDIPITGRIIPLEYFSGVRKREIEMFADFCFGGGFEVR